MSVYVIPSSNLDLLSDRVARLNDVCAKLSLPAIEYRVLSSEVKSYHDADDHEYFIKWYTVEIIGSSPVIAGYSFVAAIDHLDAGNIIRAYSGQSVPVEYQTAQANCDHCGQNRARKVTYVVHSEAGYKQVGSSCLVDFMGHADVHLIAQYLEDVLTIADDLGDFDPDRMSGGCRLIDAMELVVVTSAVIREYGWLGKGKAIETSAKSTYERVMDELYPNPYSKRERLVITDDDKVIAQSAIDWAKSSTDSSDYMNNLRVVCSEEYIKADHAGLLCSVIASWKRATMPQNGQKEGQNHAQSQYLGGIGAKVTFTAKIVKIIEISGSYGITYVVSMLSGDNQVVWFASNPAGIEVDHDYTLKGTIKDCKPYNGQNQTVVTRCKVV